MWGFDGGLVRKSGILAFAAVCAALPAVAQVQPQPQPVSATATPPAPVVDYWIGDMPITGQFKKDPGIALNGNTLNFDFGKTEPVSGTARIKIWVPEDGVVRLQIGECVTGLRPAAAGVDFTTGGAFTPDYAHTNTPVSCGLSQGEEIVKRSDTLTPVAEGIRYAYSSENKMVQPAKGKATIKGEVVLRAVMKPVPKPPRPPMASTGAVPGAPEPKGQFNLAEGVKYYGIERALDAVLQADSRAWLMNRYDKGSVTNGKFLAKSKDGLSDVLYGEYELNGGRAGWLKVQLEGGNARCIEYFDAFGICKAPGAMSVGGQMAMGAMIAALTAPDEPDDGKLSANDQFLSDQAGCKKFVC